MSKILALDLGTHCGWARNFESASGFQPRIYAGTWHLADVKALKQQKKLGLDRRSDVRVLRFWSKLDELHRRLTLDVVVFEDVTFMQSRAQAQLWSSFRAAVWLFGHTNDVVVDCLTVGELKRFATGKFKADKAMMLNEAKRQHPIISADWDDNTADAVHLLTWAEKKYELPPTAATDSAPAS